METGLDEIVECVIDEIALYGNLGCRTDDVTLLVLKALQKRTGLHEFSKLTVTTPEALNSIRKDSPLWNQLVKHHDVFYREELFTNSSRVFASLERSFLVICGHEKDFTRVSSDNYRLLSFVSSRGPTGVRAEDCLTGPGQDANSFAERLDTLTHGGYIVPLAETSGQTQRYVLRRFAPRDVSSRQPAVSDSSTLDTVSKGRNEPEERDPLLLEKDDADSQATVEENWEQDQFQRHETSVNTPEKIVTSEDCTINDGAEALPQFGDSPAKSTNDLEETVITSAVDTSVGAEVPASHADFDGEPATDFDIEPTAHPDTEPVAKPDVEPAAEPDAEPAGQADVGPVAETDGGLGADAGTQRNVEHNAGLDAESEMEGYTLRSKRRRISFDTRSFVSDFSVETTKTRETPQKVHTADVQREKREHQGRPRIFVKGTEAFWREQMLIAKRQANPGVKKLSKTGLTTDPISTALFSNRPEKFDETFVRATEEYLPVPDVPQDISQTWVDRVSAVLDRTENGVYITPRGQSSAGMGIKRPVSQIFIFRSLRLRELDLSPVSKVHEVRFIASNAAHTFHCRRYYPRIDITEIKPPLYVRASETIPPKVIEVDEQVALSQTKLRQTHGGTISIPQVTSSPEFKNYHPSSPDLTRILVSRKRKAEVIETPQRKKSKRQKRQYEFWVPIEGTAPSIGPNMDIAVLGDSSYNPATPSPFGLPPSLTTRSVRRRAQKLPETAYWPTQPNCSNGVDEEPAGDFLQQEEKNGSRPGSRDASEEAYVLDDGAVDEDSDVNFEPSMSRTQGLNSAPPKKRVKSAGRGGTVGVLRRNIILEMVNICSGAIPYNSVCPTDPFVQRWESLNHPLPADADSIKRSVKSLCDSGRLKQMKFTFRSKRGTMVTRAILAAVEIEATDVVIQNLQRNISHSEPYDYVPLELGSDASVIPEGHVHIDNTSTGSLFGNFGMLKPPPVAQQTKPRRKKSDAQALLWGSEAGGKFLPNSLEEIIGDVQHLKIDPRLRYAATISFEQDVEEVLKWELRTYKDYYPDKYHNIFINFTPDLQDGPGFEQVLPLNFLGQLWYDSNGTEISYPFAPTPLPDLAAEAHPYPPVLTNSSNASFSPHLRAPRKYLRKNPSTTPITDRYLNSNKGASYPSGVKRNRNTPRLPHLAPPEPKRHRAPTIRRKKPAGEDPHVPLKRSRGVQFLRALSPDDVYRISVTIVCVRTLAGGLEKFIDWSIVMKLFPEEDEGFVRERWKTLSNRYRRDIAGLTESLQERYLAAYKAGKVPAVDFDNLDQLDEDGRGTDWEGIVKWALAHLDRFNTKGVESLPGSKAVLSRKKDFVFEEFKGMRDLLGYNVNATNPRRDEAAAGVVFGVPMSAKSAQTRGSVLTMQMPAEVDEETDPELTLARSWVMATICTRPENWDPRKIRTKLITLATTQVSIEDLVDRALKALQRDKLIIRNRDGRAKATMLEGGWELSLKFFEFYEGKRMLPAKILKDTVRYKKEVLDRAMSHPIDATEQEAPTTRKLVIPKNGLVEDGEMVAILNLAATGRIRIKGGDDVPKNRYGLDYQRNGYQTRLLDKSVLAFGVELLPGWNPYSTGDPQESKRLPVPRGEMDQLFDGGRRTGKIPMWFDVLGNFQRELWETVVATVVGLVSLRCGINCVEIRRTLNWGISGWELDLVLGWMDGCGFVKQTGSGKGWTTEEWWWLVLAGGEDGWVVGGA